LEFSTLSLHKFTQKGPRIIVEGVWKTYSPLRQQPAIARG